MKHWKFITGVLCFTLLFSNLCASEFPQKPDPPRLVNDLAGLLSSEEAESLEQKLVAFDDSTSTQIAIITVSTIHGYDIDDYNARLGELWGVGRAGKDNGVVILVAKEEREVSIATGYGLEGVLPDAISKRIIENTIVPNFKKGDFYAGLDEASTEIMQRSAGEFDGEKDSDAGLLALLVGLVFIVGIPLIIVFFIIGAITSITYSRKGYQTSKESPRPWSFNFPKSTPTTTTSSSSGSRSSGSSSSRSFGGFGGGKFGGGGASGKW